MDKREDSRLEAFRQLKRQICGSKQHVIVGIDVAKDKHTAFVGTARGTTLCKRLVFDNNREGFTRLLMQAEAIRVQHGLGTVVFGLEPTANYHKPLAEYLIKDGHLVVLVAGNAVKKNRELLDGRWDKHDMKDSANIADLISQGKCLYYEYAEQNVRDLRSLLSLKRRLKKHEHGAKIRIRNHLLAQYFPEMDRYYRQGEAEALAVVRWCLAPAVIAGLDYGEFFALVTEHDRGLRQHRRLYALWQKARDSIGCAAGEAMRLEATVMVHELQRIREDLSATEARIKDICVQFPEYPYLLSIPGFGPDVASKVLAAVGNPFRFASAKHVVKMAGLDLSADRSGKRNDAVIPVISKKGKADLRYALYQAALVASSRNRAVISWFTTKLRGRERERGIKTKMRVKLAAKMLVIAWTLMKKKEPFDPAYVT